MRPGAKAPRGAKFCALRRKRIACAVQCRHGFRKDMPGPYKAASWPVFSRPCAKQGKTDAGTEFPVPALVCGREGRSRRAVRPGVKYRSSEQLVAALAVQAGVQVEPHRTDAGPALDGYEPGAPEYGFLYPAFRERTTGWEFINIYEKTPGKGNQITKWLLAG